MAEAAHIPDEAETRARLAIATQMIAHYNAQDADIALGTLAHEFQESVL
jgi:hypothetical protein